MNSETYLTNNPTILDSAAQMMQLLMSTAHPQMLASNFSQGVMDVQEYMRLISTLQSFNELAKFSDNIASNDTKDVSEIGANSNITAESSPNDGNFAPVSTAGPTFTNNTNTNNNNNINPENADLNGLIAKFLEDLPQQLRQQQLMQQQQQHLTQRQNCEQRNFYMQSFPSQQRQSPTLKPSKIKTVSSNIGGQSAKNPLANQTQRTNPGAMFHDQGHNTPSLIDTLNLYVNHTKQAGNSGVLAQPFDPNLARHNPSINHSTKTVEVGGCGPCRVKFFDWAEMARHAQHHYPSTFFICQTPNGNAQNSANFQSSPTITQFSPAQISALNQSHQSDNHDNNRAQIHTEPSEFSASKTTPKVVRKSRAKESKVEPAFQYEICPKCCRTFPNSNDLTAHLMEFHSAELGENSSGASCFKCCFCQIQCAGRAKLDEHLKLHLRVCTQCNKTFMTNFDLNLHMGTHTGYTYDCKDCGCCLPDRRSLADHNRAHRAQLAASRESGGSDTTENASPPAATVENGGDVKCSPIQSNRLANGTPSNNGLNEDQQGAGSLFEANPLARGPECPKRKRSSRRKNGEKSRRRTTLIPVEVDAQMLASAASTAPNEVLPQPNLREFLAQNPDLDLTKLHHLASNFHKIEEKNSPLDGAQQSGHGLNGVLATATAIIRGGAKFGAKVEDPADDEPNKEKSRTIV